MSQPEKYRTNKSTLNKFLEKKQDLGGQVWFAAMRLNATRLKELTAAADTAHKTQDFETLARLEAAGCAINEGVLLHLNSSEEFAANRAYELFTILTDNDNHSNMYRGMFYRQYWSGSMLGGGYGGTVSSSYVSGTLIEDERYTVAGKTYSSKTEFLLSRTELGRALL
jgi:hypothetical protein